MIKVIIERHLKRGSVLSPLLQEIRVAAMHHRGYVGGETLVSAQDDSFIVVISTWQSLEDWERWFASDTRTKICKQMEPFLLEESKARTFRVMATEHTAGH